MLIEGRSQTIRYQNQLPLFEHSPVITWSAIKNRQNFTFVTDNMVILDCYQKLFGFSNALGGYSRYS